MSSLSTTKQMLVALLGSTLLGACTTIPREDPYVLYRELMPSSILVFPPANESVDVNAPYSWLTTASKPIADQGYYVFPVAVVDAFMKENGLPNPEDMHAAPLNKIGEIFGADAVMYVTLEEFGQKFELLSSTTRIDARAEMVDVKTGQVIWTGKVNYADSSSGSGQGLLGDLITAAVTQISETVTDKPHEAAPIANHRLFRTGDGLLLGPLHPGFAEAMAQAEQAAAEAAAETESASEGADTPAQ